MYTSNLNNLIKLLAELEKKKPIKQSEIDLEQLETDNQMTLETLISIQQGIRDKFTDNVNKYENLHLI